MYIDRGEKWLYIGTPKCASRTMSTVLPKDFGAKSIGGEHDNRVEEYISQDEYHIWTVVRNPYDRVVSLWWRSCVQKKGREDPYNVLKEIQVSGSTEECFTGFVHWLTSCDPPDFRLDQENPYNIMFQPQWYFLDGIELEYIKLENFPACFSDLDFVPEDYELETHRNMSFDRPSIKEITKQKWVLKKLTRWLGPSFDRFDYDRVNLPHG